MKPFEVYQYLDGEAMTERDKNEIGSKFWNRGKWDNYVASFLPEDCGEMTLIDMGCNAGLFLKLAEEKGFGQIIGVDADQKSVQRGLEWRDKNKGTYQMIRSRMEECIDKLPMADYTIFANSHYYFAVSDWLDYLDKLQAKTRYCIIVTSGKKARKVCWASGDVSEVRDYFKNWDEAGFLDQVPVEGDLAPRSLFGLCFKSRFIDKVPTDSIICRNPFQDGFCEELDKGIEHDKTRYHEALKGYQRHWSADKLFRWTRGKKALYEDVKKNRLLKPVIIDAGNTIFDGNHRYAMMKHLGYKNIFVRRVGAGAVQEGIK